MRYHRIHILFPAYIHVSAPFKWQVDVMMSAIEKVPLLTFIYFALSTIFRAPSDCLNDDGKKIIVQFLFKVENDNVKI